MLEKINFKIIIGVLILKCVSANTLRITRQAFDESSESQPIDAGESHSNYCSQDLKNSFSCSDGTFDEILTEVTSQANVLKIEKVSLSNIPDFTFQTYTNLIELTITQSNIATINSKSFNGLTKLKTLNLSNNAINNLNKLYFSQIIELTTLNLSSNKIVSIIVNAFKGLGKLQDLDLSNNLIESLTVGTFSNIPNIVTIDLSKNHLSVIPSNLFSSLSKLQVINLSNNWINNIQNEAFKAVPVLKMLYLHENRLINLGAEIFGETMPQLSNISLDSNQLVRLDIDPLLIKLTGLSTIAISPNPWDCNCLNYLLEIIENKDIEYTPIEYFDGSQSVCKVIDKVSLIYSNDVNPCKVSSSVLTSTQKTPTTPTSTAIPLSSTTSNKPLTSTLRYSIPFLK